MVAFLELVLDSWERSGAVRILAVVPFLDAFLKVENLAQVLHFEGTHYSVTFPAPSPMLTVWSFADPPTAGGGVSLFAPVPLLPVLVVVEAALLAGYLGSLDAGFRTGDFEFLANVRLYFRDFLVYNVLVTVVVLAAAAAATAALPVLVAGFLALFALSYLFFAAPFLVVVEDRPVGDALARSLELALAGDEYAEFFLKHVAVGVALSVLLTPVVTTLGSVGVIVGAAVGSLVGLTLTLSTLRFLRGDVPESGLGPGRKPTVVPG